MKKGDRGPVEEANFVIEQMRRGCALAVAREAPHAAKLMRIPKHKDTPGFSGGQEAAVSQSAFELLWRRGWISELTEHRLAHRVGWRDWELPGEQFHIWALIQ